MIFFVTLFFVFQAKILAALTHVKTEANVIPLATPFIVIASLALKENIVRKVQVKPKLKISP